MTAQPIIDYASPASRSSLRLPARSEIRWDFEPGGLRVVQKLAGRERALGAVALAGFTFLLLAATTYTLTQSKRWERNIPQILFVGTLMAAELVVGALVINNTWRKTVLVVAADEMTLAFSSPFSRGQQFRFPGEQVAAVSVVDREPLEGEAVVAELELRMWSIPPVHLFAGHPHPTLMHLAKAIAQVHPMPPPPLPAPTSHADG
jgi:hypothetical protein